MGGATQSPLGEKHQVENGLPEPYRQSLLPKKKGCTQKAPQNKGWKGPKMGRKRKNILLLLSYPFPAR